jgi:DNA-binding helix-hairpin-helix protein with protein kinase domain
MTLYTERRKAVHLGSRVGGGGEGDVYRVAARGGLAAKVFHAKNRTPERMAKLQQMIREPPITGGSGRVAHEVAWPVGILYADAARTTPVGYLMPLVAGAVPAAILYDVTDRRRYAPGFTWAHLILTVRNLATVLDHVHSRGYVVGDLNECNTLVHRTATVSLIDCDSYQVRVGGRCLPCPVGKAEYTAPESQGRSFKTHERRVSDDLFALGVLAYQLLMLGHHPFSGVAIRAPDCPDTASRISRNWFSEVNIRADSRVMRSPTCPPFRILPPVIQELFIACFVAGARQPDLRPSATQWARVISRVLGGALARCSRNPLHRYGPHLARCPWCDWMTSVGADPFAPTVVASAPPSATPKARPVAVQRPAPVPAASPVPRACAVPRAGRVPNPAPVP